MSLTSYRAAPPRANSLVPVSGVTANVAETPPLNRKKAVGRPLFLIVIVLKIDLLSGHFRTACSIDLAMSYSPTP